MFGQIYNILTDTQSLAMILAAIAAAATIFSLSMPLIAGDNLDKRMKAVAVERDRIRARERERLALSGRGSLRQRPAERIRQFVERFKLGDWLGTETAKLQLVQAGFRGQKSEYTFLLFRLIVPICLTILTFLYLFFVNTHDQSLMIRIGGVVLSTYIGIKVPEIFLKNTIEKRQVSIRKAWPDALDLLLICAESGVSIEQAFRRVSREIGGSSIALAEELALTTAELSYLPERRVAFENLATRTGLETVKGVVVALVQAERYGTPIGQALRVLAQESRDTRMNEAEKKAAALPPKLTVPMILFFLPVLFAVILTPAIIQVLEWQ